MNKITYNGREVDLQFLQRQVNKGWSLLIENLVNELFSAGWNGQVTQVKEKFGELRFYTGGCTEKQYDIIDKYTSMSVKICEDCGSIEKVENRTVESLENELAGIRHPFGWTKTMCKKCRLSV